MAGNRKLPFGYRMELGEVVIHPQEAEVVKDIFRQYILGASYKVLLERLREQEVPYDQGRLWNKNMVARILEDKRYIGGSGWPVIIIAEDHSRAMEKRSGKTSPSQITEAQKVLRRLSGGSSAGYPEEQILHLLNQLIAAPEKIATPQAATIGSRRVTELQAALAQELNQQPVDESTAKRLATELAVARYEAIGNQEYETARLRKLFGRRERMEALDAELLKASISSIQVWGRKIAVQLKNGQIERG